VAIARRVGRSIRSWTLLVALGAANAAGYLLDLYQRFWRFDRIPHGCTILALTPPDRDCLHREPHRRAAAGAQAGIDPSRRGEDDRAAGGNKTSLRCVYAA
jgi:hypothetical protein